MNKKILSLFVLFLYVTISFSQNELNGYKYILVPKKYDFLKGVEDRYRLNSLTKFLFNKYGFTAIFEDEEYPHDLLLNPCLGLEVGIANNSKLLSTRLIIELNDCYNKVIYTSLEGGSRVKEYEKAYQEALRGAFESLKDLNYKFDPALVTNLLVVTNSNNSNNSTTKEAVSSSSTELAAVNSTEPVSVDKPKGTEETKVSNVENSDPKEIDSNQAQPVAEASPEPIVVPVIVNTETKEKPEDTSGSNSILKSYKNENISFFIIEQEEKLNAYVNETKDGSYKKGELIGTLSRTSIPNVYRVTWKNKEGIKKETTGYFDDEGNLKIDVMREGNIEVVIFQVEQ